VWPVSKHKLQITSFVDAWCVTGQPELVELVSSASEVEFRPL
jgi:hypothetical protein